MNRGELKENPTYGNMMMLQPKGGAQVLRQLNELLERGEWVQVKREAEQLMLLPDLNLETLGRIYRAGARACIGLGEFHTAAKLLELGLPYALRSNDWDTVGFMRHDLGACCLVLGQKETARDQFVAYLYDLPHYREARCKEGKAHYNLGLLYRQHKNYDLAIAAYRQALHCFVERGETRDAGDCHQNIAWLHLVRRDPDAARIHIDLAATFLDHLPEDFRVEQLILMAFHHAVKEEFKPGLDYLQPILENRMGSSEVHLASARWVEAQIFAGQRRWEKAQASLDEAWRYALRTRSAHLINLCTDLREQIKKELGGAAD